MPPHRIEKIVKFEEDIRSALEQRPEPEYYERIKKYLEGLCFPRDTNWANVGSLIVARHKAINAQ